MVEKLGLSGTLICWTSVQSLRFQHCLEAVTSAKGKRCWDKAMTSVGQAAHELTALPSGAKGWCVLVKYLADCSWWLLKPAFKSQHSELVSRHTFSYSCSSFSDIHNFILGHAAFLNIYGGLCFHSGTSGNVFFCGLWHLYLSTCEAFAKQSLADLEFWKFSREANVQVLLCGVFIEDGFEVFMATFALRYV